MEEGSEFRKWDELIPDALALIFKRLPFKEILTVIPRVCKSWHRAATGPYCWQEIDIEEWSSQRQPDRVDRMLQMLVTRSCGSLRKLCISGLSNTASFSFIAEHAGSLQTLRVPRCELNNSIVEQIAAKLSTITFLDLSYCAKIGSPALEAIGKNCNLLVGLCHNMHPLDMEGKASQDDEAHAIASTMPKLKRLELAYYLISTQSVMEILSKCPSMELLDLRGCWDVNLDDKLLKENFPNLKVMGPRIDDYYGQNDWDDYSTDYTDSSDYLPWDLDIDMVDFYEDEMYHAMWDDDGGLEQLELRFYEGFEGDLGFHGWPPSP